MIWFRVTCTASCRCPLEKTTVWDITHLPFVHSSYLLLSLHKTDLLIYFHFHGIHVQFFWLCVRVTVSVENDTFMSHDTNLQSQTHKGHSTNIDFYVIIFFFDICATKTIVAFDFKPDINIHLAGVTAGPIKKGHQRQCVSICLYMFLWFT